MDGHIGYRDTVTRGILNHFQMKPEHIRNQQFFAACITGTGFAIIYE
ncbi:MAG: hypothetical protein V1718_04290 [archaeon]